MSSLPTFPKRLDYLVAKAIAWRPWSCRSISSLASAFCWHRAWGGLERWDRVLKKKGEIERINALIFFASLLSTPTLNGRWWSAGIPGWIRLSITIQMVQSLIYGSRKWVACSWQTSPACPSRSYGWAFQNPFSWRRARILCFVRWALGLGYSAPYKRKSVSAAFVPDSWSPYFADTEANTNSQ